MSEETGKKIKVSACIITYNHENFIAEAIEGALSQKLDYSYEIVVAEDYSKDKTREIVIDYQKKYPDRIRAILNEKNIGMTPNWVSAVKACRGEYIAVCDGDDCWTNPRKLQIQIDELEKRPGCGASFHPALVKYMDGKEQDYVKSHYGNNIRIFDTKKALLVGGSFCPVASLVFHRKVADDLLKFDQNLGGANNDYMLGIFGSLRDGLLYVPQCMAVYRFRTAGSWTDRNKSFEKALQHASKITKLLDKLNEYLGYKYNKEIKYKITLENYTLWRRFIKINKKDFDNYGYMKKQVYGLRMEKKILVKIIFSSVIKKVKNIFK